MRYVLIILVQMLLWHTLCGISGAETPDSWQPQETLEAFVRITWRRGPDLPQGFQDSDGGFLGNWLITAGGFCSGIESDNLRKPGRYPRGFLNRVWGLDTSRQDAMWQELPPLPGEPRQGLFSAVIDDAMYFWGGFNYTDPCTYADGHRLTGSPGHWQWSRLPDLPYRLCAAAMCVAGKRIYLVGGADYDGKTGFFTASDRDGQHRRLGARLWTFNTVKPADGWVELASLPGTPRFVHAAVAVGDRIYVIGGATGDLVQNGRSYGYCTVVDNWMYDTAAGTWSRLRDLPISSGNFPKSSNLVFLNRYILLPGGHQYAWVANPDGTIRPRYGVASSFRRESGLHNDFFVYDTHTGLFGTGDKLPIDNNLPMTVVRGNEIFLLGGETGGGEIDGVWYGHHPDLLLIGQVTVAR